MSNRICFAIDPIGNTSKGEYTGYSYGLHWVSFYNGYTRGFAVIDCISFVNPGRI